MRVLRAKGMDENDKVMRQTVAFRVVQALSIAAKRGRFVSDGKRKGVRVGEFDSRTLEVPAVKENIFSGFPFRSRTV